MPWHVDKTAQCPASKPWGVIKNSDGKVVGCHATKKDANKQLAALNANVAEGDDKGTEDMSAIANENTPTTVEELPHDDLYRAAPPGIGVELRAADDGDEMPTLVTHFAVFNEWTEIDSLWEGHFMERIAPGALRKTISEHRDQIKVLFQHGRDPQIGDKPLGKPSILREDPTGTRTGKAGGYAEVPLLRTAYNAELIPGLDAGLYGASFRFRVVKEEINEEPEESDYNPHGLPERTIKELRLYEFGPVTFPAYTAADAGVRSITDEFVLPRLGRDPERLAAYLRELRADDNSGIVVLHDVHVGSADDPSDDHGSLPDDESLEGDESHNEPKADAAPSDEEPDVSTPVDDENEQRQDEDETPKPHRVHFWFVDVGDAQSPRDAQPIWLTRRVT